jgi:hypothetical protein
VSYSAGRRHDDERNRARKVIALQSSPNKDGLTYQLAMAALGGAQEAGAETELVNLTDLDLCVCKPCGRGWGRCREEGRCGQDDDFNEARQFDPRLRRRRTNPAPPQALGSTRARAAHSSSEDASLGL